MKCPKCGFMQGQKARCRKCGSPLDASAGRPPAVANRAPRSTAFESAGSVGPPPPAEPGPTALPDNPYAPPLAAPSPHGAPMAFVGGEDVFRDGDVVVARDGAPFPDRCVRCNQSARGFRIKKTFYWHPQAWYLLILVSVLIYAIVAMIVRQKASFEVALCPAHRSRRRLFVGIALALPVAAIALAILMEGDPVSVWALVIATLTAIVLAAIGVSLLRPKKIEDGWAYLAGAHPQFLATLPPLR